VNVSFAIPTKEFLEPRTAKRLQQYDLKPGDIVMTRKGTVGNCAVYPEQFEPGIMHSDLLRLRVDQRRCEPGFLVHQLHHSPDVERQLLLISGGAIMPGINVGRLKQLEVVLPPLAEQRRIAEVLDRAEALRAKRRAALAQLDELTQAIFLDMFGDPIANRSRWGTCVLETVTHKITDGTHKTPVYTDSGVEFLSAKDLKDGGVAWGTEKFISQLEHEELVKRCNPELGDVLLAKSGSLGNVAIIDRSHPFSLFESLCLIKHNRERIEGQFLTGLLRSPSMLAHLLGKNKGVAIKHLHLVDVRNLIIPLPPISLQREFARRVTAVETLKTAHRASLAELDALFASLQHRAFRGEL
jgi:type I restriction enzyme S subunit